MVVEANAAMILPGETSFVGAIKNALLPLNLEFSIGGEPGDNSVPTVLAAFPHQDIARMRFIFIDYRWGLMSTPARHFDISRATLSDLQHGWSDNAAIPPALVALTVTAELKGATRLPPGAIVVLCAAEASVAMVQVALKFGASWVWTSYVDMFGLREVVERLSAAAVATLVRKPRPRSRALPSKRRVVFVVENGYSDIATLRGKLGRMFELYFAAVDSVAPRDLSITPDAALVEFDRHGPFSAAIVDLALSDVAESGAPARYGNAEAALNAFTTAAPEATAGELRSILGGLQVVAGLRDRDLSMPIFVMSNWVNNAPVMGAIKEFLQEKFESVDFYFKAERDYLDVRDRLNALFPAESGQ
jgi:hypothetical protein